MSPSLRRGRSFPDTKAAAWYDEFHSTAQSEKPWYPAVSLLLGDVLDRTNPLMVVEVGSGTGEFLRRLHHPRVGLDLSFTANVVAHRSGVPALVGVAEMLPFREQTADLVVCCEVLEHVARPSAAIEEVRRVLRPDGVFALSFPNYMNVPWLMLRVASDVLRRPSWIVRQPTDRLTTYIGMRNMLRRHGFKVVASAGVILEPPGIFHLVRKRRRPDRAVRIWRSMGWLAFHPILVAVRDDRQRRRRI